LLSNISQVPATEQSGVSYLTKALPPHDYLVGLWHFDEVVGITASDSSGNGNLGTLVNGPTWEAGKFGNALSFDGVNDYVEVTSNSFIMPTTLTVEAWVQPDKIGARQSIVSKWDGGGDASYSLELTSDNKFLFYLHNGTKTQSITGNTVVAIGTWYHVAGTYDGSNANLYVDGNLEEGPITLVAPMTNSNVPLRIGASAACPPLYPIHSPFEGKVDEVRIWKVALSQDQLGFYGFNGLLPPYVKTKAFRIGSSIPLKWQYTDAAGNVVDSFSADPRVRIVDAGNVLPVDPTNPITVDAPGKSGLHYDSTTNMWIFNWQTKEGFTVGTTYNIWITSVQTGQANGPFPIQLK